MNLLAKDIAADDLHDKGREDEPHVTVRYGLHANVRAADVSAMIGKQPPPKLFLGKVSCFPASDTGKDYDVLKVDVKSPDLVKLNKMLGALPNTQTFDYHPHATLAYVKPGRGQKYVDAFQPLNVGVTAETVVFSDTEGVKTSIDLNPGERPTPPTGKGLKADAPGVRQNYSASLPSVRYNKGTGGPTMYSHEAFLTQIQQQPDDMTLRGVYADWLQDNAADQVDPASLEHLRKHPGPVWAVTHPQTGLIHVRPQYSWQNLVASSPPFAAVEGGLVGLPAVLARLAATHGNVPDEESDAYMDHGIFFHNPTGRVYNGIGGTHFITREDTEGAGDVFHVWRHDPETGISAPLAQTPNPMGATNHAQALAAGQPIAEASDEDY